MTYTIEAKALLNNKSVADWVKDLDAKPDHRLHKMRVQVCELIGLVSVLYRSVSFCTDDYEEQILNKGIADLGGDTCVLSIIHTQLKNIEKDLSSLQTDLREEKENAKNELVQSENGSNAPSVSST